MLILGIDPGTATTGYGLIEHDGKDFKVIEWGLIETTKDLTAEIRLVKIHKDLNSLIERVKPDIFAIERVFFATNAKTAIAVGQAIGVMMLSASFAGLAVIEYAPGTIKKSISGDGRADKKKMQAAVRQLLGAKVKSAAHKKTHFDNAADGLAVALCHIFNTTHV
ncbi:MAG: crossover junction endodeoxyribonuclease RuvC [Patescibacteria group bacterium]